MHDSERGFMPHDTILRLSQYGIAQMVELDKIINTSFALTNESIIYAMLCTR